MIYVSGFHICCSILFVASMASPDISSQTIQYRGLNQCIFLDKLGILCIQSPIVCKIKGFLNVFVRLTYSAVLN